MAVGFLSMLSDSLIMPGGNLPHIWFRPDMRIFRSLPVMGCKIIVVGVRLSVISDQCVVFLMNDHWTDFTNLLSPCRGTKSDFVSNYSVKSWYFNHWLHVVLIYNDVIKYVSYFTNQCNKLQKLYFHYSNHDFVCYPIKMLKLRILIKHENFWFKDNSLVVTLIFSWQGTLVGLCRASPWGSERSPVLIVRFKFSNVLNI